MPNIEEHCKHTKDLYGIEGREIHTWMDEPCKIFAGSHRRVRHDVSGIKDGSRIFVEKFSSEDIERVMIDHILLDAKDIKKEEVVTDRIIENNRLIEEEKDILQKRLQRAIILSKIKTNRIKDYIKITFKNAEEGSFQAVCIALSDWENFLLSRDNPISALKLSDIDSYALNLRNRVKPRTASNYLQYLALYFKHYNEIDLSNRVKERNREFKKEFSKDILLIHPKDVETLYSKAKPKAKLMIRLLLLEPQIDIGLLEKIVYSGKDAKGKVQFRIGDKITPINETTLKLAQPLLERNLRRGDLRLLSTCKRAMDEYFSIYTRKVLPYKITPNNLRRFAETQHPDVVLKVLGDKS